ncbi:arsenic resistance N-acetyltransferase ArsN2 [Acidisoma sp. L85]|jgi:amino-acid N-acetyltransferase|uniref:arsenic resistance N-acetyltransferase ArsN2 n=1 Tax=Acidisoma sp. L85 TaxID=1641850 RepID=UPI00131CABCC|nr:arsenic resistance N-acetyltransferase ArsN2 [Acidisoma sp. L85]
MTTGTVLKIERVTDIADLQKALHQAGLPTGDLNEPGRLFFRFTEAGELVGFGGLEGSAPDMLLRSIAVEAESRSKGYGGRIVTALEREAVARGVARLHLLTDTATDFFRSCGYRLADRESAPASIAVCEQLMSLCPATARYLLKTVPDAS